jgi:hypothetical protein
VNKSHSRKTYPANKAVPVEELEKYRKEIFRRDGDTYIKTSPTPEIRKWIKKFHIRKSRRYYRYEEAQAEY